MHDLIPNYYRRQRIYTPGSLLRVISLGAGVQSSTLLLMALRGEFGK